MKCIPVGFRVSSIFLKFILKIGFSVFPVTASYLVTESPIFLPVFSETSSYGLFMRLVPGSHHS